MSSSDGPCTAAMSSSSCSAGQEELQLQQGTEKQRERAEEQRAASVDHQKPSEEELEEEIDDDDEEEAAAAEDIDLGPRLSVKEQLDKDKDNESLTRWKEQLLGSVDLSSVGAAETLEPDVKIMGLSILSPGRPEIVLPLPAAPRSKEAWFTLKEGTAYRLKFTFSVTDNIVSGLRYTNTVWKTGIRVDTTKEMLGTFSPQAEPYTYLTPEETTPSGIFARGSYSARTKFLDDDRKCYLGMKYTFDIRRDWPSS